jgi:6-pyruvoyltetrahydropterin/6-carboxytetrahydropterin synthase
MTNNKFTSQKRFTGYSTCFRQWRAKSHCRFLHGYALEFLVKFEGELDERNWVMDFGCFGTNGIKEWLNTMFDHTTIIADDDPLGEHFAQLDWNEACQLRFMEHVGCEMFAKEVFKRIDHIVTKETQGRVRVTSVTVFENNKNAATYGE